MIPVRIVFANYFTKFCNIQNSFTAGFGRVIINRENIIILVILRWSTNQISIIYICSQVIETFYALTKRINGLFGYVLSENACKSLVILNTWVLYSMLCQ